MTGSTHAPTLRRSGTTAGGSLLRRVLQLDALVSGANGVAYLVAAGPLSDAFDIDAALLRVAGAVLVAFAAAVWMLAAREQIPAGGVLAVVAVNIVWALDSVAALAFGWLSPAVAGGIWVALQALVVAAFAALQAYARRG